MIKINLIPPEYAASQSKKEQQVIFGTIGAIVVVAMMGFLGVKKARAAALEKEINIAEAELKKFKAIVAQIENIEKNKQRLTAKRDVIKTLNRSRLIYPVFFEDFLPIIPSNVWVTSIDISEKGGPFTISLQCNALSNFALATWLTNLEQSPHFNGTELGTISYAEGEGGTVTLAFSLKFTYQHKGAFPLAEFY